MALSVESDSIAPGQPIGEAYAVAVPTPDGRATTGGGNRSPHLRWSGEPEGTRSFAVACVDHDVPADASKMGVEGVTIEADAERVDFAHWLVADIPADVHEIPEGADSDGFVVGGKPPGRTSYGGITGANSYTDFLAGNEGMAGTYGGWDGPYPPWNDERVHRYVFTVYALDVESLGLEPGFTLEEFRRAIEGHVLDSGELVGTYTLNPALR